MNSKTTTKHMLVVMDLLYNHEFLTADLKYLHTYQRYQSTLRH